MRSKMRSDRDIVIIDMLSADIRQYRSLTTRMDNRKIAKRLDEYLMIVHENVNDIFSEE